MKKVILIITFIHLLISTSIIAQNIGINEPNPDNSALLEMTSDSMGLLIPRMTTAQRNAIVSPATSLLIYNTTTDCLEMYAATGLWISIGCGCQLPGSFSATAGTDSTATQITANWNASSGATGYYLDVSTDANFTSFVTGYNNLSVGNVTTYNVASLTCATTYYYRVRAENSCGTSGNSNTITYTTAACSTCGSPITDARDGKTYNTVLIGSQCWMAENLNYGSYVPVVTGGQDAAGTQKYCQNLSGVNDPTCPFGGLYEWAEMMDGITAGNTNAVSCNGTGAPPNDKCVTPVQGVCPTGWHIPSHYEWTTLEKNVGTNPGAFPYDITTINVWLGTDEGGNMKVTPICGTLPCWNTPNTGATNTSGFVVLPGGASLSGGSFLNAGKYGYWWSSTETSGTLAWFRVLGYGSAQVNRNDESKLLGFSVRCVKD